MEERDVSGLSTELQTRQAILLRLEDELEAWRKQHALRVTATETASSTALPTPVPTQARTPVSPQPIAPSKPEAGSVTSITDQELAEQLSKLDWQDNRKGEGWHTWLESLPMPYRAALIIRFNNCSFRSLRIGNFNYTRFGDANEMLGKFTVKEIKR